MVFTARVFQPFAAVELIQTNLNMIFQWRCAEGNKQAVQVFNALTRLPGISRARVADRLAIVLRDHEAAWIKQMHENFVTLVDGLFSAPDERKRQNFARVNGWLRARTQQRDAVAPGDVQRIQSADCADGIRIY